MKLRIAVLPGDGIGPEIMKQGVAVLDAIAKKCNHEFEYEEALVGACAIEACGDAYPDSTHDVCMRADAVLFAAVGDLKYDNDPTLKMRPETGLLAMRKKLGLFANIRPVATFDCLLHKSPLKEELLRGADFVVIRELTGGMYFGEKHQDNDMAFDTNIYTRPEIERILKVAFEMAMKRNKHLTVVDKANVLASSRLWRQIAKEMEPQYPEVKTDYMFIDNASMRVLTEPRFFDVIVTENTFGDILTDDATLFCHTEVLEQHSGREDLCQRIGEILTGCLRPRAVDGFEERCVKAKTRRRLQAHRTSDAGGLVREDIAEGILGDDDIEESRFGEHAHRGIVDEHVVGGDVGIL